MQDLVKVSRRRASGGGAASHAVPRRAVVAGIAAFLAALAGRPSKGHAASGLTLVMVDDPNCTYCRKFDREIGHAYHRSPEARFAPLIRVRRKARELQGLDPVIYTPTFILVRRGEELGRITGYPGPSYFYPELDGLLAKAGVSPSLSPPERGTRT